MYKGAEVDHNLNMKLQFNTAGKKKKKEQMICNVCM